MKQLFGALALSLVVMCAPLHAGSKTTVEKTTKKTVKEKKPVKKAAPKPKKETTTKRTKEPAKKEAKPKKVTEKKTKTTAQRPAATMAAGKKIKDEVVGKTKEGFPVFEGSEKGHYYLKAGKKVYVQEFEGANIVGHTRDGRPIYEGPRGGHFYYTKRGNKEYVHQ